MKARLVALHGGDRIVGLAVLHEAARGVVLGVEGVERDDAPGEVQLPRQFAHRRDLVALRADADLPEHQAAAVLHRGHHHLPFALGPLGGAAHVLAVHGDGRQPGMLGAPGAQRPIQGVRRQLRERALLGM